jgi:ABC-2 type transport system permease protein
VTTTPTTVAPAEAAGPADPQPRRAGSLLRAEAHRFRSRRFIRWLLLLSVVAYVIIIPAIALTQFSKPTASLLEDAERRRDEVIAEQNSFREQCLDDPNRPDEVPVEEFCGPEFDESNIRVADFIDRPPFELAEALPAGAIAVAVATAMLAFLIGATFVGAEWSSRSMVALLFWEPRRLKVMGVKLAVTAIFAALLAVVTQAVWWGSAEIMARTRGNRDGLPADFWQDLFGQQGRSVLFVVLMALLGFGIANLVRNTAAALGAGFVYIVIIENVVRGFLPKWQEWLLVENVSALLSRDGHTIYIYENEPFGDGVRKVLVSNVHGGLVLGILTAVVVVTGVMLFKRRDLH